MLDRGEQVGWFDSTEIIVEAIVSVAGFYYFFAHSLTTDEPFVRFEMFKDRNFLSGCIFMVVVGVVLFATMALVDAVHAEHARLSDPDRRLLLGSRGVGTLLAMLMVGRLMRIVRGALPDAGRADAHRQHALRDDRFHARTRRRRRSSSPA